MQQPGHRLAAEHVIADLGQDSLLGRGQFERERAEELVEEVAGHWDRRGIGAQSCFAFAGEHGELNREQLLERDSLLGDLDILQPVGKVNDAQGLGFGWESLLGDDLGRQ